MPIDNSSRFPKPLAADLLELSEGMAIVIDGDTAPKAITAGQYLFIKNHSTLATGGYHATAAIASGASITSSNVAADANGIVNALKTNLNNVVNQIDSWDIVPITLSSNVSGGEIVCRKKNGFAYVCIYALTVKNAGDTQSLATGFPAPISQTGGGFIGANASSTKIVYSSGDCWWIGAGSSTLQGHFGSANGYQHWGQAMYMCQP